MDIEQVKEWVSYFNEDALLADGFEDAIIGICQRAASPDVVAYDREKCIEIIVESSDKNGLTDREAYEEAVEFFDFNVVGAYMGEGTPVFVRTWGPGLK